MEAIQVGPGFAAEMRGVTLADIINDDDAYKAVRAAFEQHSVLVFRDQDVSDESQLAFSRRFGPPEVTKVGSLGTGTHFVILTTIDKDGKVVPPDHRYAMRNKANQLWHTDSSFKPTPALTSVLSARIIPAKGGETEYVSTRLAFDRLDSERQKKLENSFAWHHYGHSRSKIAAGLATTDELAALVPLLRRLPRRIDRIGGALEDGRLTLSVRLLADPSDRRYLTGLVHQVLLTFLAAAAGIMAVLMIGLHGGPALTSSVSLYSFFGYCLLVIAAILAIRVLVQVFSPGSD